jgi:DNA-directed RNA polymerase subunit RPC12/RpoP
MPEIIAFAALAALSLAAHVFFRKRIRRLIGIDVTLRELRERDLRRGRRCQRCGYDLTQIDSVRCPECGEVRLYPRRMTEVAAEDGVQSHDDERDTG